MVVIGAGTMGHGIAYVAAVAGHQTVLHDESPAVLEDARVRLSRLLENGVQRGKLAPEQKEEADKRIVAAGDLAGALHGAGIVIEAVPENMELKRTILSSIEQHVTAAALIASNTSSLSIGALGGALARPERFLGMHFFNPVPAMRLVEIVRGPLTNDAIVERASAFALGLGKTPILVNDSPGFATSRLGVVLGLEAMRMFEQGVASAADIDRAMELGYNHPVGPLKLTDIVGLDVRLAIADHLHEKLGGDTYLAPSILREMVREGRLGRKSGRGFYDWDE